MSGRETNLRGERGSVSLEHMPWAPSFLAVWLRRWAPSMLVGLLLVGISCDKATPTAPSSPILPATVSGAVPGIDLMERRLQAENGWVLDVDSRTRFLQGGLPSFDAIVAEYRHGKRIEIEGNGRWVVEFTRMQLLEVHAVAVDTFREQIEQASVYAVDREFSRLLVSTRWAVYVLPWTEIDPEGDYSSFGQIAEAVDGNERVVVDVDGWRVGRQMTHALSIRVRRESSL